MDKPPKAVFYPARMLLLLPVLLLGQQFQDPLIGISFVLLLGIITGRMFPLVEVVKGDEND